MLTLRCYSSRRRRQMQHSILDHKVARGIIIARYGAFWQMMCSGDEQNSGVGWRARRQTYPPPSTHWRLVVMMMLQAVSGGPIRYMRNYTDGGGSAAAISWYRRTLPPPPEECRHC